MGKPDTEYQLGLLANDLQVALWESLGIGLEIDECASMVEHAMGQGAIRFASSTHRVNGHLVRDFAVNPHFEFWIGEVSITAGDIWRPRARA